MAYAYLAEQSFAEQKRLTQQTLDSHLQDYWLDKARMNLGVSFDLDGKESQALVESARDSIAVLDRQRKQASNALESLVGQPLGDLPAPQSLLNKNIVNDVPVGLPSDLLNLRPDIRIAEQHLRSANANIGAARAAFFPSISMTASVGTSSPSKQFILIRKPDLVICATTNTANFRRRA